MGFTCISKRESAQVHSGNLICRYIDTCSLLLTRSDYDKNRKASDQLSRTSIWRVPIDLDHQRQVVIYLDRSFYSYTLDHVKP